MHDILVTLGGTPRVWRTDRMATVVTAQTARITPDAAALEKHSGVQIAIGPACAAQGRRREGDPVPDAVVVADRCGRDAGEVHAPWTDGASMSPTLATGRPGR
jgi:hypothetical protein